MALSRRAWIGGAASLVATTPALAAGDSISRHPAFRLWDAPKKRELAPMSDQVSDLAGISQPLSQWLGGKAAVFIYWATWCPPCLAETPELNRMQLRLQAKGANTVVRPVHAYDDAGLAEARTVLTRFGGRDLETRQATPALELSGIRLFGQSPKEKGRPSIPALMLVTASGAIVGKRLGSVDPEDGEVPYWDDPRTLDMLIKLGTLS